MSIWPESNSTDKANQCTSTHPEDPEIRCELPKQHIDVLGGVHATRDERWWKQ